MPTYNFRNKDTGEITERLMSISAKDEFLEKNPEFEQVHLGAPSMGDAVRLGVTRPDSGFKEVLHKIHERTARSQLNKTSQHF